MEERLWKGGYGREVVEGCGYGREVISIVVGQKDGRAEGTEGRKDGRRRRTHIVNVTVAG